MKHSIRHLAAVGAAVVATATALWSAPAVSASNSVAPSGCSRPDGEYDFGCRTQAGRPDGWFVSAPAASLETSVPTNVR